MNIKGFLLTTIATLAVVVAGSAKASAVEVTCTAGALSTLISDTGVKDLTIKGEMDVRDFSFISTSLNALTSLDMNDVTIKAYSGDKAYFGSATAYSADALPQMAFFSKSLTNVVLPSSLKSIDNGAFSNCSSLSSVSLPGNLTSIGKYAFYGCSALTTISIPSGVQSLSEYAFAKCSALTAISSEASFTSLPDYVFSNCTALKNISFATPITSIGKGAFVNCKALTAYTFPSDLTLISEDAFKGTALESVDLSNALKLTAIGGWAFADCSALTTVSLPALDTACALTTIGEGAFFSDSALSSVALPSSVQTVADYSFSYDEAIKDVEKFLPQNVTTIGKYAFSNWSQMTVFVLPSTVTSISDKAFENCSNLTTLTSEAVEPPALGEDVFSGVDQPNTKLIVPDDTYNAYASAEQWKEFNIETVTGVEDVKEDVSQSHITAQFTGKVLTVASSDARITGVLLYDIQGNTLTNRRPDDQQFTIDTSDFSHSIYILQVQTADGTQEVFKLMRQ